jgi:hypothetical protein
VKIYLEKDLLEDLKTIDQEKPSIGSIQDLPLQLFQRCVHLKDNILDNI